MSTTTAVNASPFNCRWIVPGSAHRMGEWSCAICVRDLNTERLVNEPECAHCRRWEEPDDVAAQHARLVWNRLSSGA